MNITVSMILELDVFNEVKILTGDAGMENVINDISVLELPVLDFIEEQIFDANEFYLTGLYAYKDNPEMLNRLFDQLIKENCCGMCVIDSYFKTFSDEIVKKCQENNMVLLILPDSIPYSNILKSVFQEIIRVKDEMYIESTIESIIISDSNPAEIKRKAKFLNKWFYESHMSFFINEFEEKISSVIQSIRLETWFNKSAFVCQFRDGIVIIVSLKELSEKRYSKITDQIVSCIKSSLKSYDVGISGLNKKISKLNESLSEAIVANSACTNIKKQIVKYDNLGVYKLLYQLKSDARLSRFRDDILNPIKEYETENQIPLMETALVFIENDGDIKETAKELFLHINTVRYRIEKIKKILNQEHTRFKYYEELSLAIKADKILKKLR